MTNIKITAIIIAKNEEKVLLNCIKTLSWVDQILVLDSGSSDKTVKIAENAGAKVIHFDHSSFSRLRNEALKHVETDWLFYIDADERVTPTLAKEILVHLETSSAKALSMKRRNICYGKELLHGGWGTDQVTRVFEKRSIKQWEGKVHETPIFEGENVLLHTPLIHLTHRNTQLNLIKSANWTKIEAELLHKSGIKPVTFFTIMRKGVMEFFRRAILKQGYKDGLTGLVEALIQGINKILIYVQIWEMQQVPSLEDNYHRQEIDIMKLWETDRVAKLSTSQNKSDTD